MSDHAPSPDRLASVADALEQIDLRLAAPAVAEARHRALRTITEYLIPRQQHPDDDLVVAVVGVSGAGKSTLVNSLARRRVSDAGTRRPTTTDPVAWGGEALPATLDALRKRLPGRMVDALRPPPIGLTIVDTPPPGVVDGNGDSIAMQVLEVADVCLHVAGAHRYADSAGFDLAARAAERGLPTIFVLNRLPATPAMQSVLAADYASKLAGRGLIDSSDPGELISIAEGVISTERHGLDTDSVIGIRKELERLAELDTRQAVTRRVMTLSLDRLRESLSTLRRALIDSEVRRVELTDPVTLAYREATDSLETMVRVGAFAQVKDDPDKLAATVAAAAARRAGQAAVKAAERWERLDAGGLAVDHFTHGRETQQAAAERVRWWLSDIPRVAAETSGRSLKGRKAEQLISATRAAVLDPKHTPGRKERRVLKKHPGVVEAATRALAEEIAGIVAVDAVRFTDPLGGPPPRGALGELTVEES